MFDGLGGQGFVNTAPFSEKYITVYVAVFGKNNYLLIGY